MNTILSAVVGFAFGFELAAVAPDGLAAISGVLVFHVLVTLGERRRGRR